MVDRKFKWTVEMQIKAARANFTTLEIPVLYRCRIGAGKISKTIVGTIIAGSEILFLISRYGLAKNSHRRVSTDCGFKQHGRLRVLSFILRWACCNRRTTARAL